MVQRYWCYVTRGGGVYGSALGRSMVQRYWCYVRRGAGVYGSAQISIRKVYGPTLLVLRNTRGVGYTD